MFTTFFYFGELGLDLVFHMFFLVRYCRMLEEVRWWSCVST
jgi:Derlin-2/3